SPASRTGVGCGGTGLPSGDSPGESMVRPPQAARRARTGMAKDKRVKVMPAHPSKRSASDERREAAPWAPGLGTTRWLTPRRGRPASAAPAGGWRGRGDPRTNARNRTLLTASHDRRDGAAPEPANFNYVVKIGHLSAIGGPGRIHRGSPPSFRAEPLERRP